MRLAGVFDHMPNTSPPQSTAAGIPASNTVVKIRLPSNARIPRVKAYNIAAAGRAQ